MDLQLEGVVKELLPIQEGEGKNGPWKKQSFIMEVPSGNFPRQICIVIWGDRIDQYRLQVGDNIIASIDIESREYNGRWYTDVKAWRVERKREDAPAATAPQQEQPQTQQSAPPADPFGGTSAPDTFNTTADDDDLPF
jgi:hypothetical protein